MFMCAYIHVYHSISLCMLFVFTYTYLYVCVCIYVIYMCRYVHEHIHVHACLHAMDVCIRVLFMEGGVLAMFSFLSPAS